MTDILVKEADGKLEFYDPLDDEEAITTIPANLALIGKEQIVKFLNDLGNDAQLVE